ncbi:Uncharacterised protein [Klebsiella pneumoniae]|nr:Uncharacterised protein [Klebsiella pneumoniae]
MTCTGIPGVTAGPRNASIPCSWIIFSPPAISISCRSPRRWSLSEKGCRGEIQPAGEPLPAAPAGGTVPADALRLYGAGAERGVTQCADRSRQRPRRPVPRQYYPQLSGALAGRAAGGAGLLRRASASWRQRRLLCCAA